MSSMVRSHGRHLVPSSSRDWSNALLQLSDLLCASKTYLLSATDHCTFLKLTLCCLAGQLHPDPGVCRGGGSPDRGDDHHQRLPLHLPRQGEDATLHRAKDLPWGGWRTNQLRSLSFLLAGHDVPDRQAAFQSLHKSLKISNGINQPPRLLLQLCLQYFVPMSDHLSNGIFDELSCPTYHLCFN